MIIAVLSGKGGTGKTLVSVNLASVLKNSTYIDCDVEEPNGHLFFKPNITSTMPVEVAYPVQDESLCIGCRKCVNFCKFNALAYVNKKVMVFNDVCHSCEGCSMVCPVQAISMDEKQIGKIETGYHNDVKVVTGFLNIGEASGVPIIRQLTSDIDDENVVIDCPPGSACVVMESIKNADYLVLVAEPTVFGRANLEMVYELSQVFEKPVGVVLNKCDGGSNVSKDFCEENDIDIIGEIPFDIKLGKLVSNGEIASENGYENLFNDILNNIKERV